LLISSKIIELEKDSVTDNANIMYILLLQKKYIDSLEVECNILYSMVLSQHLDPLSLASNNHGTGNSLQGGLVEDKIVYHNRDPMEIEEPRFPHSGEGHEAHDNVHS
jgi:hypothetical protein